MRRSLGLDVLACPRCAGRLRLIDNPAVIRRGRAFENGKQRPQFLRVYHSRPDPSPTGCLDNVSLERITDGLCSLPAVIRDSMYVMAS